MTSLTLQCILPGNEIPKKKRRKKELASKYRNCPLISLRNAIAKAESLKRRENTHAVTKLEVATAMGYGNLHGTSYTVIDALIDYGLLEEAGKNKLKLSSVALDILSSNGVEHDTKYIMAVQKAAFTPSLFKEMFGIYNNRSPDDADLLSSLKELGLHLNKIGSAIRAYRETIEFVVEVTGLSDIQLPEAFDSRSISKKNAKGGLGGISSLPSSTLNDREEVKLIWRISQDCGVQIKFEGHVTREALQKLVALLDLSKDDYPSAERTAVELAHTEVTELMWRISQDCGVQIRFEGHVTREALQKLVALLDLSKDHYPSAERTAVEK